MSVHNKLSDLAIMKRAYRYNTGFTTIELVVVLIIASILAATALPRFFSANSYEEYSYQNELVSTLRAVQLRAMQQTANNVCHSVYINTAQDIVGLLATDTGNADNCHISSFHSDITQVAIDTSHSVNVSTTDVDNKFSFDSLGRPQGCGSPCQIMVTGQETLTVQIESEGYIHAL
jgi:MSHA pilin protein MshC